MKEIDIKEKLLEPLKYYNEEFFNKFKELLTLEFDTLIKESNIDIEANKKSVEEYWRINTSKESLQRKLKWLKIFIGLVIIIVIVSSFFEWKFIELINSINKTEKNKEIVYIALLTFGIIALLFLNFKYLFPKKNRYKKKIKELEIELENKEKECYAQVRDMLFLFKSNIANRIITKVIPTLNLDEYFNIERYDNLVSNFNLPTDIAKNISTTDILSGDILGNPFIIVKLLKNEVEDQVYTGSLRVSWTEEYYEDGKIKRRRKTELLTASVVKPKQVFNEEISLLFGNEAAENLSFSRVPKFIHELKPKKLEKHIKNSIKEVRKKSEYAIKNGQNFLEMGNLEFDGLFGAFDRNHEVEFRVLFTPIAQRNILALLKDEQFGDDFYFYKTGKLNEIKNMKNWIMNIERKNYFDFSFDVIKEKYFKFNEQYFENFYRLFLPILSIPIYHQDKTRDYIYQGKYKYSYNPYISEMMANELGDYVFKHIESDTPSILKTKFIKKDDNIELFKVTSFSYKKISRVDYIPKMASNGRIYDVPVEWIEYIPLSSSGNMELSKLDLEENQFEKIVASKIEKNDYSYKNNIFTIFNDSDEIKSKVILGGKDGK